MVQWFNSVGTLGFIVNLLTRSGRSLLVPHFTAKDISHINYTALRKRGFIGVVFDKDNTITKPYALTPFNREIEDGLRRAIEAFGDGSVAIFSNSAGSSDDFPLYKEANALEQSLKVAVIRHGAKKPGGVESIRSFFNTDDTSKLVFVGDRYATDIAFGNQLGMATIKTEKFTNEGDNPVVKLIRPVENTLIKTLVNCGIRPPAHNLINNADDIVI